MEIGKFITVVVAAVVGLSLFAGLILPTIDAASTVTKTYDNTANAVSVLDLVDGEESYVLVKDGSWKLNGESIYTVNIYTDKGFAFVGTGSLAGNIAFGDVTTATAINIASATSITVTADAITVVIGDQTYTTDLAWAYVTNPNGEYGLIGGSNVYVQELEDLKFIKLFGSYIAVMVGDEALYQTQTFSEYLDYREVSTGYAVALPAVISSNWTAPELIAPLSYTVSEPAEYKAMYAVIPLLVIVSIITMVAWQIRSRN